MFPDATIRKERLLMTKSLVAVREPGRLARRYAVYNPLFVWHFGRQLIRGHAAPRE